MDITLTFEYPFTHETRSQRLQVNELRTPISVRWPTFGSLTLQLRLPKSVSDLFSIQLKRSLKTRHRPQ